MTSLLDTVATKIAFQVEPWSGMVEEIKAIIPMHWREIALNHDKVPLDPDWNKYSEMEKSDVLHVVTARDEGKLIGYYILFILPHPHYHSTLMAFTDVYFIHPDYRKGRTGIKLFKFMEESLRARGGVKLIHAATKLHRDVGKIFEYLGFREIERVYSKYIGD